MNCRSSGCAACAQCRFGGRTTGNVAGCYLVAGPDWKGDKQPGLALNHCPSSRNHDDQTYEAVELLKDISARWESARHLRDLAGCSTAKDSPVCAAIRVPQAKIYAIDVSFPALKDKAELDYLNQQPTSFALPPEAVDRPRAAAGTIIAASPEFHRLLKDAGVAVATDPVAGKTAVPGARRTPERLPSARRAERGDVRGVIERLGRA